VLGLAGPQPAPEDGSYHPVPGKKVSPTADNDLPLKNTSSAKQVAATERPPLKSNNEHDSRPDTTKGKGRFAGSAPDAAQKLGPGQCDQRGLTIVTPSSEADHMPIRWTSGNTGGQEPRLLSDSATTCQSAGTPGWPPPVVTSGKTYAGIAAEAAAHRNQHARKEQVVHCGTLPDQPTTELEQAQACSGHVLESAVANNPDRQHLEAHGELNDSGKEGAGERGAKKHNECRRRSTLRTAFIPEDLEFAADPEHDAVLAGVRVPFL
jgi:hypothetical protein